MFVSLFLFIVLCALTCQLASKTEHSSRNDGRLKTLNEKLWACARARVWFVKKVAYTGERKKMSSSVCVRAFVLVQKCLGISCSCLCLLHRSKSRRFRVQLRSKSPSVIDFIAKRSAADGAQVFFSVNRLRRQAHLSIITVPFFSSTLVVCSRMSRDVAYCVRSWLKVGGEKTINIFSTEFCVVIILFALVID